MRMLKARGGSGTLHTVQRLFCRFPCVIVINLSQVIPSDSEELLSKKAHLLSRGDSIIYFESNNKLKAKSNINQTSIAS